MNIQELQIKCKNLEAEIEKLREEIKQLKIRYAVHDEQAIFNEQLPLLDIKERSVQEQTVTYLSSNPEKVELFLSLFKGRSDVCAKRWKNKSGYSPFCFNGFKPGVCFKPRIKCTDCKQSVFAPLDEEQIRKHLSGEHIIGLYPLTKDDTCYLLVMDFDESTWERDVRVVRDVCFQHHIPVYAERSRSGNGCHLWFFFEHEIKASLARKLGMTILDLSMQVSSTIHFDSYDRLFPSQDFLQKEGFGNLIALPLQKEARNQHNSVFVDESFNEIEDQWHYLSQVKKLSKAYVEKFVHEHSIKKVDEVEETLFESGLKLEINDFPPEVIIVKKKGLKIVKQGISDKGIYALRRLASYPNPEYYAKQVIRQSTYGTPRMTVNYEEDEYVLVLPRGVEERLFDVFNKTGVRYSIQEDRYCGQKLKLSFLGQLSEHQTRAFNALNAFDNGVLAATTGFGKTVIGAKLIAEKSVPSLILVHTKELAIQWKERLDQFLYIDEVIERKRNAFIIGQLGGGKNTLNGIVDIAIMQSMFEKDKEVKSVIDHYGLVIVDECHHVSAVNFSRILGATQAKYVYGLTATPIRKDGHHPIIFMQCGPLRYSVDAKQEAKRRDFDHFIVTRFTSLRMPLSVLEKDMSITEIYTQVCESKERNERIVRDVEHAINAGRNPLVLTERTQHIARLVDLMKDKDYDVIVLSGDLKTKQRRAALASIRSIKDGDRFVVIATGKLIGEGFDEARLDTLFLAMPVAWKGTIAQYAGRLHRNYLGKDEVLIYDYVDMHVPVLERMYHKRLYAYRSLGYKLQESLGQSDVVEVIYSELDYFDRVVEDIKAAKKHIVISSPYLQKKKLDHVRQSLFDKYDEGIRCMLYTKTLDMQHRQAALINKVLDDFSRHGVDVIDRLVNRYNFMIIDQSIVWYGDIAILGGKF